MSYSSRRKFHLRQPVVVDIGCNCRKPKLFTSLFSSSHHSKPKTKHIVDPFPPTTSSSSNPNNTTYTSSPWDPSCFTSSYEESTTTLSPPSLPQKPKERRRRKKKGSAGRVARESVAVVKETSEPYVAFKESMVQMIVEKEIYGWDDLNDLLHRFLSLNSPRNHHLILRAFADLWDGVFAPPSPLADCAYYGNSPPPYF